MYSFLITNLIFLIYSLHFLSRNNTVSINISNSVFNCYAYKFNILACYLLDFIRMSKKHFAYVQYTMEGQGRLQRSEELA